MLDFCLDENAERLGGMQHGFLPVYLRGHLEEPNLCLARDTVAAQEAAQQEGGQEVASVDAPVGLLAAGHS